MYSVLLFSYSRTTCEALYEMNTLKLPALLLTSCLVFLDERQSAFDPQGNAKSYAVVYYFYARLLTTYFKP
jgi:hypothetical protein